MAHIDRAKLVVHVACTNFVERESYLILVAGTHKDNEAHAMDTNGGTMTKTTPLDKG
jgi:hypothetical protein